MVLWPELARTTPAPAMRAGHCVGVGRIRLPNGGTTDCIHTEIYSTIQGSQLGSNHYKAPRSGRYARTPTRGTELGHSLRSRTFGPP